MALGMETNGYPVVMPSNNDNFGGGIGSLLIGALLFGGGLGRGGWGGWGMGGGPAASAVATDVTLAPQFNSIQTQLQGLQGQLSQNNLNAELNTLESGVTAGFLDVLGGVKDNANLYLQGTGQLSTAIANGNFTTLSSLNQALSAITAQNNQNSLQTLNSFNAVNTSMLQGFNEIGRDNAAAFNQVIMGQNALASQVSECCCGIKQAIAADGAATRELINNLNVQNLQSQLSDAKQQNATLSQTITQAAQLQAQTSTILNHLRPFTATGGSTVIV